MKVTLNWLRQYVDFTWSPEELTDRLTMLGLEVEGVQKLGGEFEGVVVAQVITRDKHPNADKLSICKVNDGKGERQIVCGAQNFKAGDKVPLILPGASLPMKPGDKEPFTIKVGKIRGVESHGMMCSSVELSIDPEQIGLKKEDGLLILRDEATVGQAFAEYLGRSGSDVVYDLEVTPNRPDLNSVIGIAREISAATGNPLKIPAVTLPEAKANATAAALIAVRIDEPNLCPRYNARVIRGVKVGPSPDWLRSILEKVGLRSINNVVDVTNYVMLEVGQPLHAFDYHLVAKGISGTPTIVVRRANAEEKFTTLDGQARTLAAESLLIADEAKPLALAGIMGGQNSEIRNDTTDVLIESAAFKPENIRWTSKKLELRTDSSYRFERGGDVGICDWASRRAAQLILQTAGGELASGCTEAFPSPAAAKQIELRHHRAAQVLGIEIAPAEQVQMLERLELKSASAAASGSTSFSVPSFRVDLKREIDLIEEIARLFGVDKIPSRAPRGTIGSHPYDPVHDQMAEARRILCGLGLSETQGQTLIGDAAARLASGEILPLENPLSSDMDVLRPSLLPGLLDVLSHNLRNKSGDLALFEIGRVFLATPQGFREERRIAIALTGRRHATFWGGADREATYDPYDLKGLLDEFLEQFGLRGLSVSKRPDPTTLFLESASIQLGKQTLGEIGQMSPATARRYDLRDAVLLAELNLDLLLARRNSAKSFKALPSFPAIRRDLAMIVPEATTHDAVLGIVRQTKPQNLETLELFDVFRGKNIPDGQKSLAYAFTYRSADKTLTDSEVSSAHEKLVTQLREQLQATVRDS